MMRLVKKKAALAALAAAAAAFTVVPAQAASAVTNPYKPEAVCGSGFKKVPGGVRPMRAGFPGGVVGYLYLLYNADSRQHCVVTMKATSLGTATTTQVALEVDSENGGGRGYNQAMQGKYRYYAGPVKLTTEGRCVRYTGMIYSVDGTMPAYAEGTHGCEDRQNWGFPGSPLGQGGQGSPFAPMDGNVPAMPGLVPPALGV
ncbi:peptidase M23 [Planomonospora sphaerica]|uniref:Peptidase M23 n=1 Tax=Planomonospora sphaerica TaxID=161355 RepID=A0A161ME73_9ACTN|nr:hypothetical protein [Planomonospora sphaerica]GAT70173.1 peptidase M23 [Planomonospora sphaerica]